MNQIISKPVISFCLIGILVGVLIVPGYSAAAEHPAQQLVIDTTEKAMAKLQADEEAVKADAKRLFDLVEEMVLPHFDFDTMSSWVLGKYWRKANNAQKKRFAKEFQILLVRTYSNALLEAIGKKIDYLPLKSKKKDATEVTIRTEVEQKGGFPLPINYKMHLKNGQWKVRDVIIDNLSLVSNYRTSFGKEIRSSGIDKLIDSLADKNSQSQSQSKSS